MSVVQLETPSAAGAKHGLTRDQFMHLVWCWWIPALIATYLLRLWYCWWRELVPDEAVYWSWSRHLDLSYFDHPPMVRVSDLAVDAHLSDRRN